MLVPLPLKKRLPFIKYATLIGFAVLVALAWRYVRLNTPLYTTGSDVPDATKLGGVDAAMEQSRKLLSSLREANWNSEKVPLSLLFLPDQKYAENPAFRKRNITAFCTEGCNPHMPPEPGREEIAFWTDIYARQGLSYYPGDRAKSRPSGFFIVGFKSGEVKKVPIEDVRMVQGQAVFPGQKIYDPDGKKLPCFRVVAPPEPALVAAVGNLVSPLSKRKIPANPSSPPGAAVSCEIPPR